MGNDLSRRKFIRVLGATGLAAFIVSTGARTAQKKKFNVVFVTGDDEYRSEITMPMIEQVLTEKARQFKCTVLYAVDPEKGEHNSKYKQNIKGLEALKTADLAVFFLRFRALPDDQLKLILDYVNSGKPIIGLRTTTHAFRYPQGHKHWNLNEGFGRDVFGQKWIVHHGHKSHTEVSVIPEMKDHSILRGIKDPISCISWLYHVTPLVGDCKPLLIGKSINSNKIKKQDKYPLTQPVAWIKTYKGARVFFTTLGHPKDFEDSSVRRLLLNAIYWALDQEVPQGGANVELLQTKVEGWVAPDTH